MHYKRYAKDIWLPDSDDPTTYIFEEDKCEILIFKVSNKRTFCNTIDYEN